MHPPPTPPGFWHTLRARYDLQALQPPEGLDARRLQAAQAHPLWPELQAWCHGEARWAARPLAVADDAQADAITLAQALGLVLDGSLQLQACRGGAQRLALRLRTKWQDMAPHRRPASAPWDAGWLRPGASGLQALQRFTPRRPTLLLADTALGAAHRQQAEALLGMQQARSAHRLRLLWLQA